MIVENAPATSATHLMVSADETDQNIVDMWLAQRPRSTTRSYKRAWGYLQSATGGVELRALRFHHLQAYIQSLRGMKLSSQGTFIAVIKSLLGFASKIGYLTFNLGALLKPPKSPSDVAQRIVGEADIQRLVALTSKPRDATLLRLAYVSGLRIAELSALKWRCFALRENGAVLSVVGKGSKLRHIFLPEHIAMAVAALRESAPDGAPIFLSRHNKPLSINRMHMIVKHAAQRAGLPPTFSMHWCRHAHASHAMDRGAPVHVVQQTLGHASLATTCRYVHCKPGASSAQFIVE